LLLTSKTASHQGRRGRSEKEVVEGEAALEAKEEEKFLDKEPQE
jgi:hypothetical protein